MSADLDVTSMLTPFDGDSPGGEDLRLDDDPNNDYRRIRDARSDARAEEGQADLDGEVSAQATRHWRDVWSDGQDYLQNQAKDLEIVAYMIEASVRLYGFPGLTASLTLVRELVENFWGELLPTPDEDGIETTLLPIARLNSDAITYALHRVPLTDDSSVGEFVLWQYTQAKRLDSMDAEERERQVERGAVTMDVFTRAVAESTDDFYRELVAELEEASEAVAALDAVFDEKAEDDAPNLSRFREGLEEAASTVRVIAGHRLADDDEEDSDFDSDDEAAEDSSDGESNGGGGGIRGGISSRSEALDVLEKVALWFERHEPQSILISEIRKVKRRATMSPVELYRDLISDETVREQLFKDVGIEDSSSEDEEDY